MTRFRTDGVENLMKMEEFDDVKQIAEEIDKMEDQVQELCKRCSACLTSVDKMGKDQLAEELQQKIDSETARTDEIKKLEEYKNTTEYVEEVAKDKLGLVYKDEIIFKPSN